MSVREDSHVSTMQQTQERMKSNEMLHICIYGEVNEFSI